MTDHDELDRLLRLRKRAQDVGLDSEDATPEDRAMMRGLMSKIAGIYSRVVLTRRDHLRGPSTQDGQ